jgi:hypothetical protein
MNSAANTIYIRPPKFEKCPPAGVLAAAETKLQELYKGSVASPVDKVVSLLRGHRYTQRPLVLYMTEYGSFASLHFLAS